MRNTIQTLMATLMFSIASPIFAHASPDHIISHSEMWLIIGIAIFISALSMVIYHMKRIFAN